MSRKLYVVADFVTEKHKKQITDIAESADFEVVFFDDHKNATGHVEDAEVIFSSVPYLLAQAPNLKWCASINAGVEPIIRKKVLPEGCLLTTGSGTYGVMISEHIVGVLLAMMKRFPEYQEFVKNHEWRHDLDIDSIYGSRVTIVGTGDIGSSTSLRLRSFCPRSIVGVNRSGVCDNGSFDEILQQGELDRVLPETDVLILCTPETAETRGMITAERIAALPQNAYIVNVGRGSMIDQDALMEALNGGRLAGAALDVMVPEPLPADHPLWDTERLYLTTHISGWMNMDQASDKSVELFCANLKRYINGEPLSNLVDVERGY